MKTLSLVIVGIALLALVSLDCSDDPSSVGLGVLPPQDSLHIISIEPAATSDTTFLSRVVGGSSTLLVGKFQTLEARALLSFSGLNSIPDSATLDSARLTVRVNYRFKDSAGTVGFAVHRFLRTLDSKFTWDTADAPGAYSDTISGTFLSNITPQDSVLSLRIDTTLIRQWIHATSGTVILIPGGNMVVGLSSSNTGAGDFRPLLTVAYHVGGGTPDSGSFRASPTISVANGDVAPQPGTMILQSATARRGVLRFDSLTVPPRVSITQAILEVAADTVSSLMNSFSDDNILVYLLRKNVLPFDSLALGTKCAAAYNGFQKVYRADIKSIVQQWLIREPNYGLLVRTSGELSTLDRIALYSSSAPDSLRPKLKITYTVLP
jgi:hypothetical protein